MVWCLASILLVTLLGPNGQDEMPTPPPVARDETFDIQVDARLLTDGMAVWSSSASVSALTPTAPVAFGECRRPGLAFAPPAPGGRVQGAGGVGLTGPTSGMLHWAADRGVFVSEGPRTILDPAWAVGDVQSLGGTSVPADLRWSGSLADPLADVTLRSAPAAIRFGAAPTVPVVEREADGGVRLGWSAVGGDLAEVRVSSPGGALVCGANEIGASLPWWSVPAVGGVVVVRITRETVTVMEGGGLVRVRASIERSVPLEPHPEQAIGEVPPPLPPWRPKGRRHSNRPPAGIFS